MKDDKLEAIIICYLFVIIAGRNYLIKKPLLRILNKGKLKSL